MFRNSQRPTEWYLLTVLKSFCLFTHKNELRVIMNRRTPQKSLIVVKIDGVALQMRVVIFDGVLLDEAVFNL